MSRVLLVKSAMLSSYHAIYTPPLGLLYVAAYARARGRHELRLLDLHVHRRTENQFIRELDDFRPDVVGISALTIEAHTAHRIARTVKKADPRVRVVVGGPHASSYPARLLEDANVDVVCLREGEETFAELLDAFENNGNLARVEGIAFRTNSQATFTSPRPFRKELDRLPFPAWDLIDFEPYFRRGRFSFLGPKRYLPVFTSRSCPYECAYCHQNFGKGFRARSPENIVAEVELLHRRYGIEEIEIIDDIFNFRRQRLLRFAELVQQRRLPLSFCFPNGLRTDRLDEETITALRRMGTIYTAVAVETASPRLQTLIKKHLDLEKVGRNIDLLAEEGIFTLGFFMLGFPTETEEELRATIDFALRSRLHTALFFIVTPFEGTALAEMAREYTNEDQCSNEQLDYLAGTQNISPIPSRSLFYQQKLAFRSFYLHPKRLWRIFRDYPHRTILGYKGKRFLHLLAHGRRGNPPILSPEAPLGVHT